MSNINRKYLSNVVDEKTVRAIQGAILEDLSNILIQSFGPKGSNTCIKENNALPMYTKDGFTILKSLAFNGVIEQAIKDDIEAITKNVATTIGDGTTSAVILSHYLFKDLNQYMTNRKDVRPMQLIRVLNGACNKINERIRQSAIECGIQDIYDIAYISANGSYWIADIIKNIYEKSGMGVFIDVSPSIGGSDTAIKYYDGMTMNTGFSDTCFVTDVRNNTCTVDNPEIYFFEDPVDTKDMAVLFDAIISRNITTPLNNHHMEAIKPTVIVCPRLSRDLSSNMDTVLAYQSKLNPGNRLPFLVITDTHQRSEIQDIYRMCGAKPIKKYIDKEIYEHDVENGMAPTPMTFQNFCGHCDQVVAYSSHTKFINPFMMKDENGNFSNEYKNLVDYLEAEISKMKEEGDTAIGSMKRRLHSLRCNLVEIVVGGISIAERDSNRHLFEDAVLNCRSAAANGVGWGANFSGLNAITEIYHEIQEQKKSEENRGITIDAETGVYRDVVAIIKDSYEALSCALYETAVTDDIEAINIMRKSIENGCPYNIRTERFDKKVKSSIESDTTVLSTVCRIIGIVVTCNQFVVPTPQHNVYTELKEVIVNE